MGTNGVLRIIYELKRAKAASLDVAIPIACIKRITLSPWIPAALTAHLKDTIGRIAGCADLKIARSTLIGNEQWKDLGDGAK